MRQQKLSEIESCTLPRLEERGGLIEVENLEGGREQGFCLKITED